MSIRDTLLSKPVAKPFEGKKGTASFSTNLSLYHEFSKLCEDRNLTPSAALTEFMLDIVNQSTKGDGK